MCFQAVKKSSSNRRCETRSTARRDATRVIADTSHAYPPPAGRSRAPRYHTRGSLAARGRLTALHARACPGPSRPSARGAEACRSAATSARRARPPWLVHLASRVAWLCRPVARMSAQRTAEANETAESRRHHTDVRSCHHTNGADCVGEQVRRLTGSRRARSCRLRWLRVGLEVVFNRRRPRTPVRLGRRS